MARKQEPLQVAKDLKGRVLTLGALLRYQPGAIVSRVIMQTPSGTVTVFAFDAGQDLSKHTAPCDALLQILEGEARITIAQHPFHVSAGACIILPAHQPHAVHAITRFKMALTMIHTV